MDRIHTVVCYARENDEFAFFMFGLVGFLSVFKQGILRNRILG